MLIRQTLAYLPAQILGPLTQFATAIALTHYLGPAEYGLTMLIFASQELVFLVCLSWWTIYMLRYSGAITNQEEKARFDATERTVLLLATLAQIAATIGVIFLTEPEVPVAFYLGAIAFTVTRSLLNLLSERARKVAAIVDYSLVQIVAPLGGLLLTLAALTFLETRSSWVLFVFALTQALVGGLVSLRLGLAGTTLRLDARIVRLALTFGVPVVLASAFGWLASNGIRFVVQELDGSTALGLLSVGWGIATRLAAVAALVVTAAAYPLAVRMMENDDPAGAREQIVRNSALLLAIIAPATLGVIAIAEPMTRLVIAPDYHAATIAILPWAMIGAAIRNLRMHGWDQLYLLFEAPRPMMVLEFGEVLITLIAAMIGLLGAGLTGAVIGTMLAAIMVAGADFLFLSSRFGLRIPAWEFLRVLIASSAMYALLWLMARHGIAASPHWLDLGMTVLAGMAAYAFVLATLFPGTIILYLRKLAGAGPRRT